MTPIAGVKLVQKITILVRQQDGGALILSVRKSDDRQSLIHPEPKPAAWHPSARLIPSDG